MQHILSKVYPKYSLLNLPGNESTTPLQLGARLGHLEIVTLLVEGYGAKTRNHWFEVPQGAEGDRVAKFLQGHGSKQIKRME